MQTIWYSLIIFTITFLVVYLIYCFETGCRIRTDILDLVQRRLYDNVKVNANDHDNDFELVLVQSLWRHGDRGPQAPFKNSRISAEEWRKIGSGIGKLTKEGVNQQIQLGKQIHQRYVESGFLPEKFDGNLIKFQSTNRNRTIQSAISNLEGMYPNVSIHDPELLIKIPKDYSKDCVNNVMCTCKRRHFLQNMAKNLEEYRKVVQDPKTQELFKNLSILTGERIDEENFWRVPDTLRCEKKHFSGIWNEKYDGDLELKLEGLNFKLNKFTSGIYTSNSFLSREVSKIQSGPIISEIYERMLKATEDPLKYYAYSSHDMTLFSVLSALGLQDLTSNDIGGWPLFASAMFIELFSRKSDGKQYFRIIYRNPSKRNSEFENVTFQMPRCNGKLYCEIENFEKINNELKVEVPILEHCQKVSDLLPVVH